MVLCAFDVVEPCAAVVAAAAAFPNDPALAAELMIEAATASQEWRFCDVGVVFLLLDAMETPRVGELLGVLYSEEAQAVLEPLHELCRDASGCADADATPADSGALVEETIGHGC